MLRQLAQKIWKLWPVSIFLMSLSLLGEIEKFIIISKRLNYLIDQWRNILHDAVELPFNLFLGILKLPKIDISSPVPETILLIFMLLFCSARHEELKRSIYSQALSIYITTTSKIINSLRAVHLKADNPFIWMLLFLFKNTLIALRWLCLTIPTFVISFSLFGVSWLVFALTLFAVIILGLNMFRSKNKLLEAGFVFMIFLSHIVVLTSISVFVAAWILELVVPVITTFIDNASV